MPRASLLALLPLVAFAAASCGAAAPGALIAAARLDPLETAPEAIAVAVGAPAALRLEDGDAAVRIAYRAEGAFLVDEAVPLRVRRAEREGSGADAPPPAAPGDAVHVARFGPEGAARFAAAQSEIKALKARGVEGEGTLNVAVVGGCLAGPAADALPVSAWMRFGPNEPYLPIMRRVDLLQALDPADAAALRARLAPCPAPGGDAEHAETKRRLRTEIRSRPRP